MASDPILAGVRLTPETLLLFGEATSKCDHIARIPFPSFGAAVDGRSVVLCAAANTALAGYRLSGPLTDALRRDCVPDPARTPSTEGDKAFTNLVQVLTGHPLFTDGSAAEVTVDAVTALNALIVGQPPVAGSSTVPAAWSRELATASAPSPTSDTDVDVDPTVRVCRAFVQATRLDLATLQHRPFADGNGRTARVLEAAVLVRNGLPLRVSGLLSCHYAEDARRYRAMAKRAAAASDDFVDYSVAGFVEILREELEHVMQPLWMRHQVRLIWAQFVDSQFAGVAPGPDTTRRRQLAADLPENGVERGQHIPDDLAALEQMQLVALDGALVVPRLDRVPLWLAPF